MIKRINDISDFEVGDLVVSPVNEACIYVVGKSGRLTELTELGGSNKKWPVKEGYYVVGRYNELFIQMRKMIHDKEGI